MEFFNIGDIQIGWDSGGYPMQPGTYAPLFRCREDKSAQTLILRGEIRRLESCTGFPRLRQDRLYEVFDADGEQLHLYHWSYWKYAYGVFPDRVGGGDQVTCLFSPVTSGGYPMNMDWFLGVSGLHRAFLKRGRVVFHAAYVDIGGEALLFAAPSETGKSTQAELWRKFAGAEIINGDRVLLGEKNGLWHAYGYPACGSSDICINRTLPLRAIVLLEQSSENAVEQVSPAAAIRSLVSGMAVYHWDGEEISRALALAQRLCAGTEVVRLRCRPDEDAVRVLKNHLEGTGNGKG